jgi:hypothetical protein
MKTRFLTRRIALAATLPFLIWSAGLAQERIDRANDAPTVTPEPAEEKPKPEEPKTEAPKVETKADEANATTLIAKQPLTPAATWLAIKDYTFDQRTEFAAALASASKALDEQARELAAKKPQRPLEVANDWELAMKEVESARSDLKSKITDLNKANIDTWDQAKERAAQAWQRAREAISQVKTTTTS